MYTNATKIVTYPELNVGDIVHFHGARFEVHTACMYREEDFGKANGHGPVMVAHARWLDGAVVSNYFGPGKDWNFQGNKLASAHIECQ